MIIWMLIIFKQGISQVLDQGIHVKLFYIILLTNDIVILMLENWQGYS